MRRSGYTGSIISFEPNARAFARLREVAELDGSWDTVAVALGASPSNAELHVTIDSQSSSILSPREHNYDFMSETPEVVQIEVRTLDSFRLATDGRPTLLKLDVQGYELEVLRGATETLRRVAAVECELSLSALYEGQALIEDVINHLRLAGMRPVSLVRAFTDYHTHEVIQMDGLFLRDVHQ